ncbi:MAG: putative ABC transporter permease [Vicinamibacterales bacterium]
MLRLCLFFLVASVLGWCVDTLLRSVRRKRFAPIRPVPFSPLYGLASLGLWAMPEGVAAARWPLQFLTFAVGICAFEYVAGAAILRVRGARMWDYTDRHFHLHGHTDLFHFFLWGGLGLLAYRWALPAIAPALGLPGHLY